MPVQNSSPMFNVAEAAEVLGCTGARVRQMLIDGEMKGKKLNEDKDRSAWLIGPPNRNAERVDDPGSVTDRK
jgi:hypothetical protein